jgi:site-specific recombinase XerD
MTQRAATSHTIASYRDTLRLLLGYVHDQTGKQLDAPRPAHIRQI